MNIDSDKLLEWIDRHTVRISNAEVHLVLNPDALHAAIQSGELTPKRVYARAPENKCKAWVTPGELHQVIDESGEYFDFIDADDEVMTGKWRKDEQIGYADWERVER